MNASSISLSLIVALIYGALYHLLRNGGFWRLILYLVLSIIGFAIGLVINQWQDWVILPVGNLDFALPSVGSLALLVLGDWLSRIDDTPQSKV